MSLLTGSMIRRPNGLTAEACGTPLQEVRGKRLMPAARKVIDSNDRNIPHPNPSDSKRGAKDCDEFLGVAHQSSSESWATLSPCAGHQDPKLASARRNPCPCDLASRLHKGPKATDRRDQEDD